MAASAELPAIETVSTLTTEERAGILDLLFEPCTQLHTLSVALLHDEKFSSYSELIQGVKLQLTELHRSNLASDKEWLEAILSAHPRLGEKKVESALSRKEQAGLQSSDAGDEVEKLRHLNAEYEKKFPGLRYVTFVDGRPRSVIMDDMKKRIDSSNLDQEKSDAIQAMCDIAVDRSKKLGA